MKDQKDNEKQGQRFNHPENEELFEKEAAELFIIGIIDDTGEGAADQFCELLAHIKEAIDKDPQGAAVASASLQSLIELAYLKTHVHKEILARYIKASQGHSTPQEDVREIYGERGKKKPAPEESIVLKEKEVAADE